MRTPGKLQVCTAVPLPASAAIAICRLAKAVSPLEKIALGRFGAAMIERGGGHLDGHHGAASRATPRPDCVPDCHHSPTVAVQLAEHPLIAHMFWEGGCSVIRWVGVGASVIDALHGWRRPVLMGVRASTRSGPQTGDAEEAP